MPKLNIWEAAGRPTSYNPMPIGWGNVVTALPQFDYIISFRAKSATSKSFTITKGGAVIDIILTPEFKEYRYEFRFSAANFHFYYDGVAGPSDIIIEDIKLVEKPLGRATINGIDGFQSGKWIFSSDVTVTDDKSLIVNAPAAWLESQIVIPCLPSTLYSLKYDATNGLGIVGNPCNSAGSSTGANFNGGSFINGTFTTPADCYFFKLRLLPNKAGVFTISNPMLNLGNPVPYEKKCGERMVPPSPAKNLVRESAVTITAPTTSSVIHDELVPTEIGKIYTISAIVPTGIVIQPRIGSTSTVYGANNLVGDGTRKSMTLVAVDTFITLRKFNSGAAGTFLITEIQVEENEFMTPFESYRVRTTRKARKIPKKNMFNGFYEDGYLTSTVFNEKPNTSTQGQRTTGWMYCKPNTSYVVSGGDRSSWHFKNVQGVITAGSATEAVTTPSDAYYMRVYYSSNGSHENVQIEEGTVPTAFEPFRLGIRKRTSGVPKKNLFDKTKAITGMFINSGTGVPTASGLGQAISDFIPISASTSYVGSGIKSAPASSGGIGLAYYNQSLACIGGLSYDQGKSLGAFTTPASTAFVRITFMGTDIDSVQLEPGTVPTDFEPYKLVSRPAPKGLEFNGKTDYLSMNHRYMYTVDVTVRFIVGPEKRETYKMLWGSSNAATYIGMRPGSMSLFCSLILGGVQLTIPGDSNQLTIDKIHEVRMTYDNAFIRIYLDGKLVKELAETRPLTGYPGSYFGRYTGAGTYYHDSTILSAKSPGLFDFDFTNYRNNLGTKFRGNDGNLADIVGTPIQLNRQARR